MSSQPRPSQERWQEIKENAELAALERRSATDMLAESTTAYAIASHATTVKKLDVILELRSPELPKPKKKLEPSAPADQPVPMKMKPCVKRLSFYWMSFSYEFYENDASV